MDTTETQSKSKKPLIIGIICIVVAIAVVGCFVLFMLNEKKQKGSCTYTCCIYV